MRVGLLWRPYRNDDAAPEPVFENLFRKNGTPADPDMDEGVGANETEAEAQSASVLSPAESQAWRDRILAAGSDDSALLQLVREAPSVELKLAALQALTLEDSLKVAMDEHRGRDKRLYRTAKSGWEAARAKRAAIAEADALLAGARG